MNSTEPVVIIGGGPAGRAAADILPDARIIARPEATAWHAEPARIWIETAAGVDAVAFEHLLLCADEPLLLMALGCTFAAGRPIVNLVGATSVPGVYAAGRILGAQTPEEAARQGRISANALAGRGVDGHIVPAPLADVAPSQRLDPLDIALLLEGPLGPARNCAALKQAGARGHRVLDLIAPARPVGFAALAAIAPPSLRDREPQRDTASLQEEPTR